MLYRAIGLMSGSSLDGLDVVFAEFEESGGKWKYEIKAADCLAYTTEWSKQLENAPNLPAYDYLLLHAAYGKFLGEQVNTFIGTNNLFHQVQLIASHGHTVFHEPAKGMTAQLGCGAAIAAETEINVVSDLRAIDVAFGGQGAPIVPIGEKLLFPEVSAFLNLGGIANISYNNNGQYTAFDVCAANRVLNMLANEMGEPFDNGGSIAASGKLYAPLLNRLNMQAYYAKPSPKSLDNSFGINVIFPLLHAFDISNADRMRTYVEHIAMQVAFALDASVKNLLVTGGGALNGFLISRIKAFLPAEVEVSVPEAALINYKEALIMALIGVLRWREQYNVIDTVTGARRSSINGAVWIGQEG